MSDDKLETTVPCTTTTTAAAAVDDDDDELQTNPSSPPSLPIPPSPAAQMSSIKLGSLTNRILSPSNINSSPLSANSSSSTPTSPIKTSCHSSSTVRRTFNICDILAKPALPSVDSNNNHNSPLTHPIEKPKAHRFTEYTKKIFEQQTKSFSDQKTPSTNKKLAYSHSDDDDDDEDDEEHHGSVSDCDLSGNENDLVVRKSDDTLSFFRRMSIRNGW